MTLFFSGCAVRDISALPKQDSIWDFPPAVSPGQVNAPFILACGDHPVYITAPQTCHIKIWKWQELLGFSSGIRNDWHVWGAVMYTGWSPQARKVEINGDSKRKIKSRMFNPYVCTSVCVLKGQNSHGSDHRIYLRLFSLQSFAITLMSSHFVCSSCVRFQSHCGQGYKYVYSKWVGNEYHHHIYRPAEPVIFGYVPGFERKTLLPAIFTICKPMTTYEQTCIHPYAASVGTKPFWRALGMIQGSLFPIGQAKLSKLHWLL